MPGESTQAFDAVAEQYQQKALLQNKAAKKLLALLQPAGQEDIIDIGCGPGHITDALKFLTRGRVLGTDISAGMIEEARAQYRNLEFQQADADELEYHEAFDLGFCNSAFQWFRKPEQAARAMLRLLRPGGRLGIACPTAWPTFAQWVDRVAQTEDIRPVFAHWKNPWFLLPDLQAYQTLFEQAGFMTCHAELAEETSLVNTEQAYQFYLSGANNGYTGPMFYNQALPETYIQTFTRLVRQEIENAAVAGKVNIEFKRLYYIGRKK
jgi:trans-aconitate methyltransferase